MLEASPGTGAGRLGVIADGRPDVFPVNYQAEDTALVFLTGTGTKTRVLDDDGAWNSAGATFRRLHRERKGLSPWAT